MALDIHRASEVRGKSAAILAEKIRANECKEPKDFSKQVKEMRQILEKSNQ